MTTAVARRPRHWGPMPETCPACAIRCFCSYAASDTHTLACIAAHGRAADRAEADRTPCRDPRCGHEARNHHPVTGECAVEEETRRAYVDGDGIHDSVFGPCRCGGLRTEERP